MLTVPSLFSIHYKMCITSSKAASSLLPPETLNPGTEVGKPLDSSDDESESVLTSNKASSSLLPPKTLNPEAEEWKPSSDYESLLILSSQRNELVSQPQMVFQFFASPARFFPLLPYYPNPPLPVSSHYSVITILPSCTPPPALLLPNVDCFYGAEPLVFHGGGEVSCGGGKMSCFEEELFGNGGKRKTKKWIRKSPQNNASTVGEGNSCFPARHRKPKSGWKIKLRSYETNDGRVAAAGGGAVNPPPIEEKATTLMIRNIPNKLRRDFMLEFLDNFCNKYTLEYDFFYLPMDFCKKGNLGYAFVNLTTAAAAQKLKLVLQNYEWGTVETNEGRFVSRKICELTWARIQGKERLVRRFKDSCFACNKLEYLPVVFDPPRNGFDSEPTPPMVVGCLKS